MTSDDISREVTPAGHGGLALLARDLQTRLGRMFALNIAVDVEDDDGAQLAHALLRHRQQLRTVFGKFHALHRRQEIPRLQAFPGSNVPNANGVVGGASGEECGGGVYIDRPQGALMAMIGAQSLAVGREPCAHDVVFGGREENIAIFVIPGESVSDQRPRKSAACFLT